MLHEENTYGLAYNPDTESCLTTPLTLLRYIRDQRLPIPEQGILRIPLIVTLRICANLNNIDGGILGGGEKSEFVSPDVAWVIVTRVIDRVRAVYGEMNAIQK